MEEREREREREKKRARERERERESVRASGTTERIQSEFIENNNSSNY